MWPIFAVVLPLLHCCGTTNIVWWLISVLFFSLPGIPCSVNTLFTGMASAWNVFSFRLWGTGDGWGEAMSWMEEGGDDGCDGGGGWTGLCVYGTHFHHLHTVCWHLVGLFGMKKGCEYMCHGLWWEQNCDINFFVTHRVYTHGGWYYDWWHAVNIDATADVHRLLLLQERGMFWFSSSVMLKVGEIIFLFVKMCMNYPQAIISMKLMKFTVLYTATMKGSELLLRKS